MRRAAIAGMCCAMVGAGCALGADIAFDSTTLSRSDVDAFSSLEADARTVRDSVQVSSHNSNRMDLEIEAQALVTDNDDADRFLDELRLLFNERAGGVLDVEPRYRGPYVETFELLAFDLRLPVGTGVGIRVVDASVDIVGLDAPVDVVARGGEINVTTTSTAEVETVFGDVIVNGDAVTVVTTSGDIVASAVGLLDLDSDDGDITATAAGGGDISSRTGTVDATVSGTAFVSLAVSSDDGPVTVALQEGEGYLLTVIPGVGGVNVDAGDAFYQDSATTTLMVNGGGPAVTVSSRSGGITVVDAP